MEKRLPEDNGTGYTAHHITTLTDFQIRLDVDQVLEGQGIPPHRASESLRNAAQGVIHEAHQLLAPAALTAILPVQRFEHQQILLGDGASFHGSLVARALAGATQVAVAVCTIGPALEQRMEALFAAGEATRAMALEGAGVAAIRQVADAVGVSICDTATARGLKVGMRASPGQEGWPIQQQRVLFGLIPAEEIGIRLTSSCLMLPRKSVSFAMGLGPEMRADSVPCDFCSKRERCNWNRATAH
ncbi:MAG: vitamin B12 dependent-methionine synthase activation domain-containing protein [Anaerolineae bacterium]